MATSGDIGPCIGLSESSDVHRDKKVVIPERDEILLNPLANSTPIGDIVKESGYATLEANEGDSSDQFGKDNWSGPGLLDQDGTVVENPQVKEKRQPKGKSYKLTQSTREKRRLKREVQTLMANIGALMGQDKNLKSVGEECKNLNDRFNLFGEIHEEIQEHLTEDEKSKDCRIYDDLF